MTGTINEPHPNEAAVEDPEDFFGPESGKTDDAGAEAEPPTGDPEVTDIPADPESAPDPEPAPAEEPESPAEPAGAAASGSAGGSAVEPAASSDDDDVVDDAEEESGNKREYIVLQEIVLDQEALQELLKQVKGGVEPVVALVEIHRTKVTTQKAALAAAWRLHGEAWEAPPRLAAVTASKLRVRGVRVKMREVTGVDFD